MTHSLTTLSSVTRDLVRLFVLGTRSRRALAAENLYLRKQLALFQERKVKAHRAHDSTRLIMVILGRMFWWRDAGIAVQLRNPVGSGRNCDGIFAGTQKTLDLVVMLGVLLTQFGKEGIGRRTLQLCVRASEEGFNFVPEIGVVRTDMTEKFSTLTRLFL